MLQLWALGVGKKYIPSGVKESVYTIVVTKKLLTVTSLCVMTNAHTIVVAFLSFLVHILFNHSSIVVVTAN